MHDSEAARECVHDVFLHLWRRQNDVCHPAWELESVLGDLRSQRRAPAAAEIKQRMMPQSVSFRLRLPMKWKRIIIERERVTRALGKLTSDQSDVVQRAYYGGMTLSEVAADLDDADRNGEGAVEHCAPRLACLAYSRECRCRLTSISAKRLSFSLPVDYDAAELCDGRSARHSCLCAA